MSEPKDFAEQTLNQRAAEAGVTFEPERVVQLTASQIKAPEKRPGGFTELGMKVDKFVKDVRAKFDKNRGKIGLGVGAGLALLATSLGGGASPTQADILVAVNNCEKQVQEYRGVSEEPPVVVGEVPTIPEPTPPGEQPPAEPPSEPPGEKPPEQPPTQPPGEPPVVPPGEQPPPEPEPKPLKPGWGGPKGGHYGPPGLGFTPDKPGTKVIPPGQNKPDNPNKPDNSGQQTGGESGTGTGGGETGTATGGTGTEQAPTPEPTQAPAATPEPVTNPAGHVPPGKNKP